jgi:hypothetical protein
VRLSPSKTKERRENNFKILHMQLNSSIEYWPKSIRKAQEKKNHVSRSLVSVTSAVPIFFMQHSFVPANSDFGKGRLCRTSVVRFDSVRPAAPKDALVSAET